MPLPPLWIADQARNDGAGHDTSTLWFDESLIMLFQRGCLQRGRMLFFIILVPTNGRIRSAMTVWCVRSHPALWILP